MRLGHEKAGRGSSALACVALAFPRLRRVWSAAGVLGAGAAVVKDSKSAFPASQRSLHIPTDGVKTHTEGLFRAITQARVHAPATTQTMPSPRRSFGAVACALAVARAGTLGHGPAVARVLTLTLTHTSKPATELIDTSFRGARMGSRAPFLT